MNPAPKSLGDNNNKKVRPSWNIVGAAGDGVPRPTSDRPFDPINIRNCD